MVRIDSLDLILGDRLSIAINLGNAVLARTEADGRPGGITVLLAEKIAQALNANLTLLPYPTAGKVVDDASAGKWDIAFLAIDPKREETISFTAPYIAIQGTVLVANASRWQSVNEMDRAGVVINVGQGAAYDLFLSRTLKHAVLNRYPSSQHAVAAFLGGEGDMAAGVRQPLEQAAESHAGFRVLADNFTQINQAMCVPKTKTLLHEHLCRLLAQWQSDGTVASVIAANQLGD